MDSAFLQSWEIWWCRLSLLSRWPLSYQVGQFRQCSTLQYIWAYRWTPRGCWLSSEDVRGGMFPRSTSIVYDKSNLIQGTTLVWNTTSLRSKMSTSGELCTRMRRRLTFFPPLKRTTMWRSFVNEKDIPTCGTNPAKSAARGERPSGPRRRRREDMLRKRLATYRSARCRWRKHHLRAPNKVIC